MLSEINSWLNSNQLLVFSILLPLISSAVAFYSARYSTKLALSNSRIDRNLQKELKLADFRQLWINDFRDDIAALQGYVLAHSHVPSDEFGKEVGKIIARIQMRLHKDDPDREAMNSSLKKLISEAQGKKVDEAEALTIVGQRILKREWERLKKDLEAANGTTT